MVTRPLVKSNRTVREDRPPTSVAWALRPFCASNFRQGVEIAGADVENALLIQQLRAAGHFDDQPAAVRAQIVGGVKQPRHARVHKHERRAGGLGRVYFESGSMR